MATTTSTSGPVESQSATKDRRLASERLDRFLESVREMEEYIQKQRSAGAKDEQEPVKQADPPRR